MQPGPQRGLHTSCKMAKPGKTKQTKGVDIVIILLVTVLLLFFLVFFLVLSPY